MPKFVYYIFAIVVVCAGMLVWFFCAKNKDKKKREKLLQDLHNGNAQGAAENPEKEPEKGKTEQEKLADGLENYSWQEEKVDVAPQPKRKRFVMRTSQGQENTKTDAQSEEGNTEAVTPQKETQNTKKDNDLDAKFKAYEQFLRKKLHIDEVENDLKENSDEGDNDSQREDEVVAKSDAEFDDGDEDEYEDSENWDGQNAPTSSENADLNDRLEEKNENSVTQNAGEGARKSRGSFADMFENQHVREGVNERSGAARYPESVLREVRDFDYETVRGKSISEIRTILSGMSSQAKELLMSNILARRDYDDED